MARRNDARSPKFSSGQRVELPARADDVVPAHGLLRAHLADAVFDGLRDDASVAPAAEEMLNLLVLVGLPIAHLHECDQLHNGSVLEARPVLDGEPPFGRRPGHHVKVVVMVIEERVLRRLAQLLGGAGQAVTTPRPAPPERSLSPHSLTDELQNHAAPEGRVVPLRLNQRVDDATTTSCKALCREVELEAAGLQSGPGAHEIDRLHQWLQTGSS